MKKKIFSSCNALEIPLRPGNSSFQFSPQWGQMNCWNVSTRSAHLSMSLAFTNGLRCRKTNEVREPTTIATSTTTHAVVETTSVPWGARFEEIEARLSNGLQPCPGMPLLEPNKESISVSMPTAVALLRTLSYEEVITKLHIIAFPVHSATQIQKNQARRYQHLQIRSLINLSMPWSSQASNEFQECRPGHRTRWLWRCEEALSKSPVLETGGQVFVMKYSP